MAKKLLVVNDILLGGGVEKLMYDIVDYYHDKYEITVLTDVRDKRFESTYPQNVKYLYQMEEPYPEGRNVIERKLIKYKRKKVEEKLKKKIKTMNFDVLLCMKESWIMMMAMTYGEYIPSRIGWVHTDYSKSYYTQCWYGSPENEVEFMKKFNHVVCVSGVIEESIKKVIGDPGNLITLYNPVNKNHILNLSKEEVGDIKRSERPLFVTVGRLNIQKGYDILLEVCNLLNAQGYKYDVWIVGGGESFNNYAVLHELEDMVRRYKLDNVYLLGERSNPYKYMAQGDWFLSSSRYEGYSYVSQEAAILNKPLMLTECSGVMELLETEENGVVVENSYRGIYEGMKKAIENPNMYKDYIGKVKIGTHENFMDDRIKAIEDLF